jgi:hypothetical protein
MIFLFAVLILLGILALHAWRCMPPELQSLILTKAKAMLDRARRVVADKLFRRRMSYKHLFLGDRGELNPAARIVLADLSKFCRGLNSTTVVSPVTKQVDPIASALAEGRREVWLRIMKELSLDPADAIAVMKEEDALAA